MKQKSPGFTLIEMLVTIALMGLMAVICWRGLAYVAAQRDAVEREAGELAQVLRIFAQLERDLAERLPDAALPVRSARTELPLALALSPAAAGAEVEILRFVPQAAGRPAAQRVLYRVGAGGLVRSTRPLGDPRAPVASEVLLLPGAATLQVRVHAGGFWVQPAREQGVQPAVPASALEIAIDDGSGARYIKVLAL